jgi:hypothetical protein
MRCRTFFRGHLSTAFDQLDDACRCRESQHQRGKSRERKIYYAERVGVVSAGVPLPKKKRTTW